MRWPSMFLRNWALVLGVSLALTGCARAPSQPPRAAPIPVTVSHPVERNVTDYVDITGRTEAVKSVEIRARVDGYLIRMPFKEGAEVKVGDLLFEIDPRPYKATYDQTVAQIALAQAQLKQATADYARAIEVAKTPGAISQQDLDKFAAAQGAAEAQVQAAEANANSARLNLQFTNVISPIDGQVSRYYVTEGNLVQSGQIGGGTLLTTIMSVDPMYAYFDVDELTVQRFGQSVRDGKAESASETEWPVALGLATDEGFPHRGTINFVDNHVNPKTGTLRVRGVFPNKDKSLSPGFFARVRVPIGPPHQVLLVSDRALDNDQGQRVVYVVNDKNEVIACPVRVGALHDGLRAIEDGLKPGERVIVNGLQLVRPGITVEPKLVDMPTSGVRGQESGIRSQDSEGAARVAKTTP
jgi:RND family efflux transporter MFP subunit